MNKQTAHCVKCYRPAKFWVGYVLRKKQEKQEAILAGWCSKKCSGSAGFVGHWRQEMGAGKVYQPHDPQENPPTRGYNGTKDGTPTKGFK